MVVLFNSKIGKKEYPELCIGASIHIMTGDYRIDVEKAKMFDKRDFLVCDLSKYCNITTIYNRFKISPTTDDVLIDIHLDRHGQFTRRKDKKRGNLGSIPVQDFFLEYPIERCSK